MTDGQFQRACFDADLVFKALKDDAFRARLLADPTRVYGEELRAAVPGHAVPDGVEIKVAEERENVFYLVLPCVPQEMNLSDEALRRVARHERTHRNPCWGLGDPPE